jgi:hypothetical protein
MQGSIDSLHASVTTQPVRPVKGGPPRTRTPFQNNFTPSGQGCFYCSEDHCWATCLYKAQDEKDGKIKINGNKIRFTNSASIPQEPGMNIQDSVWKYLPTTVASWIYEGVDEEPDMGYIPPSTLTTLTILKQEEGLNQHDLKYENLKG